jgi:hypothetical protein
MSSQTIAVTPLPLHINGHDFIPNAAGMFNLTAMHKTLELEASKRPAQWRTEVSRALSKGANLHIKEGKGGYTLATESAAVAYSMWVSNEFYQLVIHAFIAMRNNALASALVMQQLNDEQREAVSRSSRAVARITNLAHRPKLRWKEATLFCGIDHPQKAKAMLADCGYIEAVPYINSNRTKVNQWRPTDKGLSVGIGEEWAGLMGWQFAFNYAGRKWLENVAPRINDRTKRSRRSA